MVNECQVLYDTQSDARQLASNAFRNLDLSYLFYGNIDSREIHQSLSTNADLNNELGKQSRCLSYQGIHALLSRNTSKLYQRNSHYFIPQVHHDNQNVLAGFDVTDAVMLLKKEANSFSFFIFGSKTEHYTSKLAMTHPMLLIAAKYNFLNRGQSLIKKLKGYQTQGRKIITIGEQKMAHNPEEFLKNCKTELYHMTLSNGQSVRISNKERLVMLYLSHACTAKEVGGHMGIAESTVNTHINNIKQKLGIFTKGEMMHFYLQSDLIFLDDCYSLSHTE